MPMLEGDRNAETTRVHGPITEAMA